MQRYLSSYTDMEYSTSKRLPSSNILLSFLFHISSLFRLATSIIENKLLSFVQRFSYNIYYRGNALRFLYFCYILMCFTTLAPSTMNAFMRPPTSYPSLLHVLQHGPLKVSLIGSGNWGSAVAKIVASNAQNSHMFDSDVRIWVLEEMVEGRKLTDWINTSHENRKYLPGIKLPSNLRAVPDLVECCKNADMLVFVLPHQFVQKSCEDLVAAGILASHTRAISLVKGLFVHDGFPQTITSAIGNSLNIAPPCVLGGANVAKDIANGDFAEATIGFDESETETASIWQFLFDTPCFKVNALADPTGVQVCGALKNIIALVGGFCDGLGYGTNTKAALIRIGVKEMEIFGQLFFQDLLADTFFDSAGYADVITTVFGGRNARCAQEFIRQKCKKSWGDIEQELLNGQKLQGTLTLEEVHQVITANSVEHLFPLYMATYNVAFRGADPESIIDVFRIPLKRNILRPSDCIKLQTPLLIQRARQVIHEARRTGQKVTSPLNKQKLIN